MIRLNQSKGVFEGDRSHTMGLTLSTGCSGAASTTIRGGAVSFSASTKTNQLD